MATTKSTKKAGAKKAGAKKAGAKKAGAKKSSAMKAAEAAVNNIVFTAATASGPGLSTPATAATQFNGTVQYPGVSAVLVSGGSADLLIMFKPSGNYTTADIGATASFLRFSLGKQPGAPLSVIGHAANVFGPCILMISAS